MPFLFNCGYLYFVNNCITIWVSFFTLAARKLKSNFAVTIIGSTYKYCFRLHFQLSYLQFYLEIPLALFEF